MSLGYAERRFAYLERLQKQKERLDRQRKRVEAGKKRLKFQDSRINQQQVSENTRAEDAWNRGQKITGLDIMERKKRSKEIRWRSMWKSQKKAKFDLSARKLKDEIVEK